MGAEQLMSQLESDLSPETGRWGLETKATMEAFDTPNRPQRLRMSLARYCQVDRDTGGRSAAL